MGVQSDAINTLAEVHNRQVQKGLKTYGKPVVPFNGRSAYTDAIEEIVDTAVYVTQLEQERTILKLALESLYGACTRFLDSPLSSVVNSHVRMQFAEEVRSVREDLGTVGFVLNDDADERYYADSIAAFHTHIKIMIDDEDEYGGTVQDTSNCHHEGFASVLVGIQREHCPYVEGTEAYNEWQKGWEDGYGLYMDQKVDAAVYDAEDVGEGGCMGDPSPVCPKCGDGLEWDSGDDSVGWPGQWYCALCDREGAVEDEV